jgi:RND family efflux transporter MFP subunit
LTSSEKSNITSQQSALDSKITALTSRQDAVIEQIDTNNDSIRAAEKKVENAKTTLTESEKQLALKTSIDPYDIQTQEMNIKQKKDALSEAKERLNDYYITAPFSGVVAEVAAEQGNYISKGGTIATVMTEKQVAEITLNEVDVTDVKVGQKATFTFDAIEDMTATGEVIEVGLIGNVSQGVVSYPVKILLNDSDERIKAGMSTSVNIIVSAKQDVVMVPTSSIKTSGGSSYILTPAEGESIDSANLSGAAIKLVSQPTQSSIEVGDSSGEYSEVLSGIDEGDLIITKSVTSSTIKTTSSQGQSLFNFGGGMRPQGTTVRTTNSK